MKDVHTSLSRAFGVDTLFRGQRRALTTHKKEVFYGGGLGCGKSYIGALWAILRALENPGTTVLVVAQSHAIHKENLFPLVMQHLDSFAVNQGFSLVSKVTMAFPITIHLRNGSKILFVSDQWLIANRGPQFSAILIDELSKCSHPEALYMEALGRLRDPHAKHRQIMVLSNLEHGLTGTLATFIKRVRAGEKKVDLILSGTRENTTLPDDYIPSLMASMSRSRYLALVEGFIIRPQASVFPEFSRKRHVIQWPERQCHGYPWVVGIDWGLQSAILVGLAIRVSPAGAIHPDTDRAPADSLPGILAVDESVDDANNTHEKVIHFAESKIIPKWERLTGQAPRALVYDPAPGKNVARLVSQLSKKVGTESWHYDQSNPDEKAAAPRYERIRSWLDPVQGVPRFYCSKELADRPSSQTRGIATSLESLPRATYRGDYIDGIQLGTPFEHIVDTAGYCSQYLDRTPRSISYIAAPLTRALRDSSYR